MAAKKLMLDYVYEHEMARSSQVFLSQPLGGDRGLGPDASALARGARALRRASLSGAG